MNKTHIDFASSLSLCADRMTDVHFPIKDIASVLLYNDSFKTWTGSLDNKHHYGDGGLVKHTWEVYMIASQNKQLLNLDVDDRELFFACLFHDSGKLYDYAKNETNGEWVAIPHKREIHHISRSALIWHDAVQKDKLMYNFYHDNVLHAILSHHGSREFGSPVSPKTKVAWLLHTADMTSARLDDCERVDRYI